MMGGSFRYEVRTASAQRTADVSCDPEVSQSSAEASAGQEPGSDKAATNGPNLLGGDQRLAHQQ